MMCVHGSRFVNVLTYVVHFLALCIHLEMMNIDIENMMARRPLTTNQL